MFFRPTTTDYNTGNSNNPMEIPIVYVYFETRVGQLLDLHYIEQYFFVLRNET